MMISFIKVKPKFLVTVGFAVWFLTINLWYHVTRASEPAQAGVVAMQPVNSCVLPPTPADSEAFNMPNAVHQIWKDNNLHTYPVRSSHQTWKNTLEPLNYTVQVWTDVDIELLVKTKYPWLYTTYRSYPHDIQRADIGRLVIIHAHGGIYADLDVHPRAIVEELACLKHRYGHGGVFAPTTSGGVSNHFFLAAKGSLFIQWALREAKLRGSKAWWIWPPYLRVFWLTGSLMITSVFEEFTWTFEGWDHGLVVLGDSYFRKLAHHGAGRGAWQGLDGFVLNYVADHLRLNGALAILAFVVGLGLLMRSARRHPWARGLHCWRS